MNPENSTPPIGQPFEQPTHNIFQYTLVVAFVIFVLSGVLGYGFYSFSLGRILDDGMQRNLDGEVIDPDVYSENRGILRSAATLYKDRDFATSGEILQDLLADGDAVASLTAQQITQARRGMLALYRATGDPSDSIIAVEELKKTVLDERIPMDKRADALTTLANSHCWFARSDEVVAAIYSEEPFKSKWHGDATQANHDMLLWAYTDFAKTPKGAASLAYWYADQVVLNDLIKETLTDEVRAQYVAEAKRYIQESRELANAEIARTSVSGANDAYVNRTRYIGYLYRRAFAIGALASVGEIPVTEYQDAFDEFFSEADRVGLVVAQQYTPFAHVLVAQFEKTLGGPDATIQSHLKAAIAAVDSDPNPQSNEIVDFIRDKSFDLEGRYSWHAIQQMRAESVEWDAFVSTVELAGKNQTN